MLSATLTHKASTKAILLTLVSASTLDSWLKKQSDAVAAWFKTTNFTGQAETFAMIPDKDGQLSRVVAGIGETPSLWDLAGLPAKLPSGTYVLEGAKTARLEEKLALGWLLGGYAFSLHKKKKQNKTTLCLSDKTDIAKVTYLAETIARARDMISTPAQELTPEDLFQHVRKIAKEHKAKLTQTVGDDLLRNGFNAIHAVGRASPCPPRLIDLTWGKAKDPKLTLIGKGVSFDTGGLDLKPPSSMLMMQKDMGGAAVALAVAALVMKNKLPVRLRLLIPAAENSIGGNAYRPSDVLTMKNGLTVEVGNTDAEGRLILADALAEAEAEKPDWLIDFATLGPARGMFGPEMGTYYTNDESIAKDLNKINIEQEDYVWRMPLHAPFKSWIETPFADLNNISGQPYGGSITAAIFLEQFCQQAAKRIHFDFMGWNTSSKSGRPQGGEAMTLRTAYALIEKRFATE
ncbi:MAG: M17 family metallopeptidase [Bdellovibrionales bacterium]